MEHMRQCHCRTWTSTRRISNALHDSFISDTVMKTFVSASFSQNQQDSRSMRGSLGRSLVDLTWALHWVVRASCQYSAGVIPFSAMARISGSVRFSFRVSPIALGKREAIVVDAISLCSLSTVSPTSSRNRRHFLNGHVVYQRLQHVCICRCCGQYTDAMSVIDVLERKPYQH